MLYSFESCQILIAESISLCDICSFPDCYSRLQLVSGCQVELSVNMLMSFYVILSSAAVMRVGLPFTSMTSSLVLGLLDTISNTFQRCEYVIGLLHKVDGS